MYNNIISNKNHTDQYNSILMSIEQNKSIYKMNNDSKLAKDTYAESRVTYHAKVCIFLVLIQIT